VRLEGLGKLKKIHLIGTRNRDLPACNIVSQPTMLPREPCVIIHKLEKEVDVNLKYRYKYQIIYCMPEQIGMLTEIR
jgi:hypothetical protein